MWVNWFYNPSQLSRLCDSLNDTWLFLNVSIFTIRDNFSDYLRPLLSPSMLPFPRYWPLSFPLSLSCDCFMFPISPPSPSSFRSCLQIFFHYSELNKDAESNIEIGSSVDFIMQNRQVSSCFASSKKGGVYVCHFNLQFPYTLWA